MEEAKKVLQQFWGYSDFRSDQKKVISSILSKNNTLALLPTGGGKSICYQVPGMVLKGVVIVVSPLIALMNDQIEGLKSRNISAIAITSAMSFKEMMIAMENAVYGKYKFVYVSPERISNELFQSKLRDMDVAFFAIDEAHCISQWGFDFRPSYLQLHVLRELQPNAPILALTASAPPKVSADIIHHLQMEHVEFIRGDFSRPNLSYYFIETENKSNTTLNILKKNPTTPTIIYGYTRKEVREFSTWLNANGLPTGFYHGGLTKEEREKARIQWMKNEKPIICATNAFGMGIDKPDVKFVIHQNLPLSIEAYYQEAGRAGRNGNRAWAITLFSAGDINLLRERLVRSFPSISEIKRVYKAVTNFYLLAPGTGKERSFPFDIHTFSKQFNIAPTLVLSSIKFLEKEGYLSLSDSARTPSRVYIQTSQQQLYGLSIRDKRLGKTIEILLRSYTGLFDDFVTINESLIAQRAGIERKEVVTHFRELAKMELLNYNEQSETPWITFTEEVILDSNLHISPSNYHELKKIAEQRLEAFIQLLTAKKQCRNQIIMAYFGMETDEKCGICDICLSERKANLNSEKYAEISEKILKLAQENRSYDEIISSFNESQKRDALKVISFLRDEGILTE